MKHLPLIIAAAVSFAVIAPAASAKTSVRQAQRMCTTAAKALDNVKSARASDDGQKVSNSTADIPVRITYEDGSRAKMLCTIDRSAGEITSLEVVE